jgi:hypothetical protein
MARCKYTGCRGTIERLIGTDTWVREGTVSPDGMAGDTLCVGGGSDNIHMPIVPVTIETHPGDTRGDATWCDWGPCIDPALYLVDGDDATCAEHLSVTVDYRLMSKTAP